MKRFLIISIFLGIILQAGMASATIDFNPLEKYYRPGDYVNLGGIFTNNYTEDKNVVIEQVLLHKDLDPMPGVIDKLVKHGRIAIIRGLGFTVQGIADSGIYTYMVTVYEDGIPLESSRISFEIIESNKQFENIRVETCASPDCKRSKSVFVVKETAYIKVFDSGGAALKGYIEDEFGFKKNLYFRGGMEEFNLEKAGQFIVRVSAEKEGYENYEMEMKFYVIEGNYMLTEFFPMINWIYNVLFTIIVLAVLITAVLSLLRGKKDKLEEWLKWRMWRRKERWGYSI